MAQGSRRTGRRQNTRKFPSTDVQGPQSHVEFSKPTWGETREAVDTIRERTRKFLGTALTVREGRAVPRGNEASEVEDTISAFLWNLACDKFVEWNWVDDDGEPLPPLQDLSMDDLLGDEVEFIFSCIQILYKMTDEDRSGK